MQLNLTEEEREELIRTLCDRCDLDLRPKIDNAMEKKQLDEVLQINQLLEINQTILFRLMEL